MSVLRLLEGFTVSLPATARMYSGSVDDELPPEGVPEASILHNLETGELYYRGGGHWYPISPPKAKAS